MTLGERIFEYRNRVNMSQEKIAEKIGVTRQTISKWETDQSTPDFDKILPLCEILGITTEELIKGEKAKDAEEVNTVQDDYHKIRSKRKAMVLSISIFLYCIATFSLPYMTEVLKYEDAHAVMVWAILSTIATIIIVYFFIAYPGKKNSKNIKDGIAEINNKIEEINELDENNLKVKTIGARSKLESLVIEIVAMFFLIMYLIISFVTMSWHITWILWLVFAFVELIVKLIFDLKGEKKNEK